MIVRDETTSPGLITAAEIAEALGMSEGTIYDWIRRGLIPSTKNGRHWIVTRAAYERWLEGDRPGEAAETTVDQHMLTTLLRGLELTLEVKTESTVTITIKDVRPAKRR